MTEVLEKEVEFLTPQDKAEAILYGAAVPKFTSDHDLTEYDELADKYGVQPAPVPAAAFVPPPPVMQSYAPPAVEKQPQKNSFGQYISPDDTITADRLPKYRTPAPVPAQKIAEETVVMRAADMDTYAEAEDAVEKEYVWKFKPKTMVAVACVAVVLALLATLLIVNAVNIAKANVELAQMESEYRAAESNYQNADAAAQAARQNMLNEINAGGGTALPVGTLPTEYDRYTPPVDLESSTNPFDALCEFLSKIF